MRYLIMLMMLMPLAACSTPEEVAEREAQKEINVCTKAGYQPGTPGFDDCRMQVKNIEDQKKADRIAAASTIGESSASRSGAPITPSGNSMPY